MNPSLKKSTHLILFLISSMILSLPVQAQFHMNLGNFHGFHQPSQWRMQAPQAFHHNSIQLTGGAGGAAMAAMRMMAEASYRNPNLPPRVDLPPAPPPAAPAADSPTDQGTASPASAAGQHVHLALAAVNTATFTQQWESIRPSLLDDAPEGGVEIFRDQVGSLIEYPDSAEEVDFESTPDADLLDILDTEEGLHEVDVQEDLSLSHTTAELLSDGKTHVLYLNSRFIEAASGGIFDISEIFDLNYTGNCEPRLQLWQSGDYQDGVALKRTQGGHVLVAEAQWADWETAAGLAPLHVLSAKNGDVAMQKSLAGQMWHWLSSAASATGEFTVDALGGAADAYTFGGTEWLREQLGHEDLVDTSSMAYKIGSVLGSIAPSPGSAIKAGIAGKRVLSFAMHAADAKAMKAAQLALNKAKGAAGEAMAGIARAGKKRLMIPGTTRWRVPDEVAEKFVLEVKNVQKQGWTKQLQDYKILAESLKKKLVIMMPPNVQKTKAFQEVLDKNKHMITIEDLK